MDAPVVAGRYTALVIPGRYAVSVNWSKKVGKQPGLDPNSPEAQADGFAEQVPAKFNTQSTLTADVSADRAVHDFALETKGKK